MLMKKKKKTFLILDRNYLILEYYQDFQIQNRLQGI